MEFKFKSNSPHSYMRYSGYQGEYIDDEYYLVPQVNMNLREVYDMFSQIDSALVDLLNFGRMCMDTDSENTKFICAHTFAERYGFLGFMLDAPVDPDFLLNNEVTLKENNFVSKKRKLKIEDYFKLFFPKATKEELSYSIEDGKIVINSTSDLQNLLKQTSIKNQFIYSSFYCEKIDWFVEYAKKMYTIFKKVNDLSNRTLRDFDEYKARELINNYNVSGIPYRINITGRTPEICWQPNSLKQALDMYFGFVLCDKNKTIRICKHCGKVFYAQNPKAEYDSSQCRNQANVYKSRNKKKNENEE